MPLKFRAEGDGDYACGYLDVIAEDITSSILINPYYNNSFPGETAETQYDKINKFLKEGGNFHAYFSNHNGESYFSVRNDVFTLGGGEYGPTFGSNCTVTCSYSKNKEEIDKLMRFMLPKPEEDTK